MLRGVCGEEVRTPKLRMEVGVWISKLTEEGVREIWVLRAACGVRREEGKGELAEEDGEEVVGFGRLFNSLLYPLFGVDFIAKGVGFEGFPVQTKVLCAGLGVLVRAILVVGEGELLLLPSGRGIYWNVEGVEIAKGDGKGGA